MTYVLRRPHVHKEELLSPPLRICSLRAQQQWYNFTGTHRDAEGVHVRTGASNGVHILPLNVCPHVKSGICKNKKKCISRRKKPAEKKKEWRSVAPTCVQRLLAADVFRQHCIQIAHLRREGPGYLEQEMRSTDSFDGQKNTFAGLYTA